ncbi:hypothetical protein [Protofrankia sp. BMG5.30]|uniref:hypothetical protein n=1 Tax=Protofrankia sp. BMG5.30 TaxID=1834514 RepID=UPI00158C8131|nr:hypothetical protein [Protofrankia sp. BMG5.30]
MAPAASGEAGTEHRDTESGAGDGSDRERRRHTAATRMYATLRDRLGGRLLGG